MNEDRKSQDAHNIINICRYVKHFKSIINLSYNMM